MRYKKMLVTLLAAVICCVTAVSMPVPEGENNYGVARWVTSGSHT